jgi:hypothetical protein
LARMRRYRTHHPHRSCGWLRQAKAAESLIAVPAFYIPAAPHRTFRRSRPRVPSPYSPVICPSGVVAIFLSSPVCKNISLHPSGKSSLQVRAIPSHKRGVSRSSGNAGRDAMYAAASCVRWDRRAGFFEIRERCQARGREMLQRTARSCGPDAPTLASSSRMLGRPYRASGPTSVRGRRWQKSPVTGESAKETVKTIACGNAG